MLENRIQLQITSYTSLNIQLFITYLTYLLTKNKILDFKIAYVGIPTQVKKFTLLKSPHIFKTARTQIQTKLYKELITITNFKTIKHFHKLEHLIVFLIKNLPIAIKLHIKSRIRLFI